MKYVMIDKDTFIVDRQVTGSKPSTMKFTLLEVDEAEYPQDITGYTYNEVDGSFTLENLDLAKENKLQELNKYLDESHKAYLAKYPEVEVASFQQKATESALVMANVNTPLADTYYLSALTNNDLTARNTLAVAVDAKVKENAQMETYGVVTRDAIKSCTTVAEVEGIVIG